MSNESTKITKRDRFQICPEWVFMSRISGDAVRLYLVMSKLADNETGKHYYGRKRLAELMGFSSTRTLDKYLTELENIGALKVTAQWDGDRQTSNEYEIIQAQPVQDTPPLARTCTDGGARTCTDGGARTCSQSKTLYDLRPSKIKNNGDASAADSLPLDLPKQTGSKAPDVYTNEFLDFWKHYPSTANKRGAFKAYKAALKDHTADQLLAYLQRWVSSRKLAASRKEFVPHAPHAATWLNQRRWEDLDEQQQGGRISQAIEQQQQAASSPVDLTREDVDRILGQDYWVAPDPPEAVRGDLRAERDWTRQLAAEHAKARQIEAQRRLAAL